MDVLALLRSQIACLSKYLETTQNFILTMDKGGVASWHQELYTFQARREAILKAYSLYDRKIEEAVLAQQENLPGKSPQWSQDDLRALLAKKESLLSSIREE